MSDIPWKFEENQFLSATEGRLPLMGEILRDHQPKLNIAAAANPAFTDTLDATNQLLAAWNLAESALENAQAAGPAATAALVDKLASLTRKPDLDTNSPLESWDATIRTQVAFGGSVYLYLLPQGRETLTLGSNDDRVQALKDFSTRLSEQTTKPALVALAGTVHAFHAAAKDLLTIQTNKENAVVQARAALEVLRLQIARQMFRTVGIAMSVWNHEDDAFHIGELWNLSLIRHPSPALPEAPVRPEWDMTAHSLTVPELPLRATRLEAWRLGPGGAPERLVTGERGATTVVIPADITWDVDDHYQLWLHGRNASGIGPESPRVDWEAQ